MSDVELLQEAWHSFGTQYKSAELRLVGIRRPSLRLFQGILLFRNGICEARNSRLYDELEFHHEVVNPNIAYDLMLHPRRNSWEGLRVLDKFSALTFEQEISTLNFPKSSWPRPLGQGKRISGWPERQFMLRCASGGGHSGYVPGPFVAETGEVIVQMETFVARALEAPLADFWMSNPGILAVLPDYRVAISGISLERGKVHIALKWGEPKKPISMQIVAIHGRRETQLIASETSSGFSAELSRIPDRLIIALFREGNFIPLDWADFSPLGPDLDPSIHVSLGTEELRELIAAGENGNVEFKANATTANREDILETLVSFANTAGGQMLVGIDKTGTAIGVSERSVGQRITTWAHELIEPRLTIQCLEADFDGKRIVVVKIPPGNEKPYFITKSQTVFVRHGETDQRATRAEMASFFRTDKPAYGFL